MSNDFILSSVLSLMINNLQRKISLIYGYGFIFDFILPSSASTQQNRADLALISMRRAARLKHSVRNYPPDRPNGILVKQQ